MGLHYDRQAHAYLGRQYVVSERALNRRLSQLLAANIEPEVALAQALDEASWDDQQQGVQILARLRRCQHCHDRLPRRRRHYCTVVCEAEAYLRAVRDDPERA